MTESTNNENVPNIIAATNSQTAISTESFFSLKEKSKMVQKIFDIKNEEYPPEGRVYFERREGEYKHQPYQFSRIFDIKDLCRAYNAMFLEKPFNSARFIAKIFEIEKDNLFKENDQEIAYYTSVLTLYRYNTLVNGRKLNAPKYNLLRWHVLEIYKYMVHEKVESIYPNSNKMNNYCNRIIATLQSADRVYENYFKDCFKVIDSLSPDLPTRDTIKRSKYNSELIEEVKSYLSVKK